MPTSFTTHSSGDILTHTHVNTIQSAINAIEVGSPFYLATAGSSNAYTATASPALAAYAAGNFFFIKANHTNTGAATININSLGAKNISKLDGTDLVGGELVSGSVYLIVYEGTIGEFMLISHTSIEIDNETPSGTINSSNTVFTLAETPNPAGSLQLFYNGLFQVQGVDYTLSTNTITYTTAPATGNNHRAFYKA